MACAVSVFGQEYELDTIYRAENVDTLPVSRFDRRSLDILVHNYAFIPNKAQNKGIEGTVIVSFVVYKNGGSASDIKVIQSPDTLGILDSAAIGVVKMLFDLKPAIKDGKPVSVRIEMPIEYHLRKDVYEENYEEYQSYSVQHRKYYYTPSNASFAGRFYVSVHYGAISLLNQDFHIIKTGFLNHSKDI
jgi:TonB family protein